MAIHTKLQRLSDIKYRRTFSKLLKRLESDLISLGKVDYEVEVSPFKSSKSLFQRFIGHGLDEPREIMSIYTEYHGCPVEIAIGVTKHSIMMPYFVFVEIPQPMEGYAEFRRGTFGSKWHISPVNNSRQMDLKRTIPKTQMKHIAKQGVVYSIQTGHVLEPTENGSTIWSVQSGFERGVFSSNKPKPSKFLRAIPSVEAMLGKWSEGR